MSEEGYLTTREVALKLQRTTKTVSEMAARGTIPAVKVGGDWRFLWTEVTEALRPPADPWRKPVRPLRRVS